MQFENIYVGYIATWWMTMRHASKGGAGWLLIADCD
jgi:hypothetical protein